MRWFWNRSKQDLSEELESHLQMAVEDRIAEGESPADARKAAMRGVWQPASYRRCNPKALGMGLA